MTWKEGLLLGTALSALVVTFGFVEPIPQWPEYHDFADSRTLWGVPNALDVLSNVPFLIIGAWGAARLARVMARQGCDTTSASYLLFFVAFALVAAGSAFYHLSPTNETLVWDRLPMTVAFMALLGALIAESVGRRVALALLPVLLALGAGSVFYWIHTERIGQGDLRAYGLVQFLPFALIALMLALYPRPRKYLKYLLWAVAFYMAAKLFEAFDLATYQSLRAVSGHTLKHVLASGCGLCVLLMLSRRGRVHDTLVDGEP